MATVHTHHHGPCDHDQLPPPPLASRMKAIIPLWVWPVVIAGGAMAACVYTFANDPNTTTGVYPQCPFKAYTGWDCPGCGMTRGVYALMKGDPVKMLNHNILLVVLLPAMLYGYLRWTLQSFGLRAPRPIHLKPWQSIGLAVFTLAFWVVRNVPGPLSWLNSVA